MTIRLWHASPALLLLVGLLLVGLTACTGLPSDSGTSRQHSSGQILVFGGTGRLGSEIVHDLVGAGHPVTVFALPGSDRSRLAGLAVDYVSGDVLDEATVAAAFRDKRFASVIDALARGPSTPSFYQTSAENIARHAARAGVDHLILHGSVGANDSARLFEDEPLNDTLQQVLAAKSKGELAIVASGVPYTIIRNGILLRHGVVASGNARLVEDQMMFGKVTRDGLGHLTLDCINNPTCHNKIYHAVDPTLSAGAE